MTNVIYVFSVYIFGGFTIKINGLVAGYDLKNEIEMGSIIIRYKK